MNPKLDLVLERNLDVPAELVWMAWTRPEHLKKWYCPRPWMVTDCEIDLRPGGVFRTTMRGPEGDEATYTGCYLEVVENRRLVWTLALEPGFRPSTYTSDVPVFTAVITMEPHGSGTKFRAVAMHRDEEGRNTHDRMGFQEGWGTAIDQLVEAMGALAPR